MIKDIFQAIKSNDMFLSCTLQGETIGAITQGYHTLKIEPINEDEFGIFEKDAAGIFDMVHSGTEEEIIDYINC